MNIRKIFLSLAFLMCLDATVSLPVEAKSLTNQELSEIKAFKKHKKEEKHAKKIAKKYAKKHAKKHISKKKKEKAHRNMQEKQGDSVNPKKQRGPQGAPAQPAAPVSPAQPIGEAGVPKATTPQAQPAAVPVAPAQPAAVPVTPAQPAA